MNMEEKLERLEDFYDLIETIYLYGNQSYEIGNLLDEIAVAIKNLKEELEVD